MLQAVQVHSGDLGPTSHATAVQQINAVAMDIGQNNMIEEPDIMNAEGESEDLQQLQRQVGLLPERTVPVTSKPRRPPMAAPEADDSATHGRDRPGSQSNPVGEPTTAANPIDGDGESIDQVDKTNVDTIREYINSKRNVNTLKKTESCTRKFSEWLRVSPRNEMRDFVDIPVVAMDRYVAGFLIELKKENGQEYEPDSLTSFHRAIDRKLQEINYGFSLVSSSEFAMSKKVLETRRRELKQAGKGNKPFKADSLSQSEEEKLWEIGQLGMGDPNALLNTVWYFNTKLFGFRGSHESRQLRWGDISSLTDENGAGWLQFNERETKTRSGNSTHFRPFQPKIFENTKNPDRCPVRAHHLYSEKRPSEMNQADAPFYLAVNTKCDPSMLNSRPWFKRQPMGPDRINKFMPRMAKAAGLQGRKTNHSVRRTMCTQLFQAGVPPTMIAQLSGHKNVQSISNYACASLNQQRAMCNILQGNSSQSEAQPQVLCSTVTNAPCPAINAASHSGSHDLDSMDSSVVVSAIQDQIQRATETSTSGIFSGAAFSGNVKIKIQNVNIRL